mgnify:CR=1 FL=1
MRAFIAALLLCGLAAGCAGAPLPPEAPEATGASGAGETAPAATATLAPAPQAASRTPLVVFAAGSLIVPFAAVEAAFEEANPDIDVRAEYHGSIQVIRHVTELHEPIDVVATADAALLPMLMYSAADPDTGRPYADWHIRFASNHLALAYQGESKYADEITAENWAEILARPDVKLGLSDPRFDAAGYRGLMAFALEQERRGVYTLFRPMFDGQFTSPITLFLDDVDDGDVAATITVPEILETRPRSHVVLRGASIQLVALLQSGDIDYAFEYESVIRQRGLELLSLPDEVNLGSPEHEAAYGKVQVDLDFKRFSTVKPQFRGERIGYGITIPANAPQPEAAERFIAFLLGPEGRQVMADNAHPLFDRPLADGFEQMPPGLQALSERAAER